MSSTEDSSRWTAPAPLRTTEGLDVYVDAPVAAGHAIFGFPTFVFRGDSLAQLAAGVLRTRGGHVQPIPLPTGTSRMESVRAIADGSGGAHVLWAESSPAGVEIRHARFNGVAWTHTATVTPGVPLRWYGSAVSELVRSEEMIAVAMPGDVVAPGAVGPDAREPGAADAAVVLMYDGTGWRVTRISTRPAAGMVATVSLAALPTGRLVLGLTSVARDGAPDENSLFVTHSDDRGRSWAPVRLVRRSGARPAHDAQLTVVGGANARAIALSWRSQGVGPDSLSAIRSLDGGMTWQSVVSTPLPSRADALAATGLCTGQLAIVARTWRNDSTAVFTVVETVDAIDRTARREGSRTTVLPGPAPLTVPGVLRLGDSTVVAWGTERTKSDRARAAAGSPQPLTVATTRLAGPDARCRTP